MESNILKGVHAESQLSTHDSPQIEDVPPISRKASCLSHSPLIHAAAELSVRSARDQITDFKTYTTTLENR